MTVVLVFNPLCFEELTMWLIKDFAFQFPVANPVTGEYELLALSSSYERPTFAALLRSMRRSIVWFVSLSDDFGQVLFRGRNKLTFKSADRQMDSTPRLSDRTVSRCQTLLRGFTASRPIRPWYARREAFDAPKRHCLRCAF